MNEVRLLPVAEVGMFGDSGISLPLSRLFLINLTAMTVACSMLMHCCANRGSERVVFDLQVSGLGRWHEVMRFSVFFGLAIIYLVVGGRC